MDENFKDLYKKFIKIEKKGWVESKRSGTTGIGYTFDELLGKKEDDFPIPDFKGIEIKTMRRYSKRKIHLLNITPDGDFLFPIKRILDILGYPDKNYPEYKVLYLDLNAKEFTSIGYYKKAKLFVNREKEKVDVIALNSNGKNLEVNISWSFQLLRERLNLKLKYLAIVVADSKFLDGKEYFHYNDIKLYKLKSFEDFISLIEKGDIVINFKIGINKSENKLGHIHDSGTDFCIKEKNIKYLFYRY